ncbi:hypothetical protein HZA99_05655, partial [Candidatus Woesearchaeota archaeon]|nr:hypothetical protein [Candidatus Woesearchaeota archaeon]
AIPEDVVSLRYRKRRFVLPERYCDNKTPIVALQKENNSQDIKEIIAEVSSSKGLQLKLF